MASVPLVPVKAREGAGAWLLRRRCTVAAVVPLVSVKAREGAEAWLLRRRCTVAAVVPLVPAKAREGAGAWLLLRRCIVAAVVPLVRAKAREGAGVWLLLRRCTVAAVVPLVPAKAREGAGGWLLLRRQCCTVAAAVVSHERFRTITMTTTVLRRKPRDITAGAAAATAVGRRRYRKIVASAAAAATVVLRWVGKGWYVGIYAIALEEAIEAQMPKLTTGVAESVEPPWRRPGDTIAGAAVIFHRLGRFVSYIFLQKYKSVYKSRLPCAMCFRSRRPCPPTLAFAVYKSLE